MDLAKVQGPRPRGQGPGARAKRGAHRWALPGGVLRIDLDADLDAACQRVAQERLGIALPHPVQLEARGGRHRDPRAPWALSVVYRSVVQAGELLARPGKRLSDLKWAGVDQAVADAKLAFDRASRIAHAAQALRSEVAALAFPAGLLPPEFTLGELQAASAAVLGRPLDKSSFRRRLDAEGCVEPVEGQMRLGAFRPAQVYRMLDAGDGHGLDGQEARAEPRTDTRAGRPAA